MDGDQSDVCANIQSRIARFHDERTDSRDFAVQVSYEICSSADIVVQRGKQFSARNMRPNAIAAWASEDVYEFGIRKRTATTVKGISSCYQRDESLS